MLRAAHSVSLPTDDTIAQSYILCLDEAVSTSWSSDRPVPPRDHHRRVSGRTEDDGEECDDRNENGVPHSGLASMASDAARKRVCFPGAGIARRRESEC